MRSVVRVMVQPSARWPGAGWPSDEGNAKHYAARTHEGQYSAPEVVGASLDSGGTPRSEGEHHVLGMRSSGRYESRLPRPRKEGDRPVWLGRAARRAGPGSPAVGLHGRADDVRAARTGGYGPVQAPSGGSAERCGRAPATRRRTPARGAGQAGGRTVHPDRGDRRADRVPDDRCRAVRAPYSRAAGGSRGQPRSLAMGARVSRSAGRPASAGEADDCLGCPTRRLGRSPA
jgi:hypothetical protein